MGTGNEGSITSLPRMKGTSSPIQVCFGQWDKESMPWMMGTGNPDPVCFGLWDQAIQYKSALDVGNRSAVSGGITAETIMDQGTTTRRHSFRLSADVSW